MEWQCPRCNKVLSSKQRLVSHLQNTQKVCSQNSEDVERGRKYIEKMTLTTSKSFKCQYCQRLYSHKSNLCRHEKKCSKRSPVDTAGLEQEIVRLKQIIEQSKTSAISVSNSNDTLVIQGNHNTINQVIGPFGNEKVSEIITLDWLKTQRPAGINPTILEAIKAVHFNPNYPEYMNVYISNLKDKICKVFTALGFWINADKDETIDDAYDNVTEAVQSLLDSLDDNEDHGLKGFGKRWEQFMQRDRAVEMVKKDIESMMVNLRELVKSTHHIGKKR